MMRLLPPRQSGRGRPPSEPTTTYDLPLGREPVVVPRRGHDFVPAALPLLQALAGVAGARFWADAGRLRCEVAGVSTLVTGIEPVWILHEIFVVGVYDLIDRLPCDERVVVWDIGMNRGLASLYFASKPHVAAVVGQEPVGPTYRAALETLASHPRLAGKVTALDVGVADSTRTETVDYCAAFSGSVGVRGLVGDPARLRAVLGVDDPGPITREPLRLREANEALATVRDLHPGLPVVAKVDCEGAEYEILAALRRTGALSGLHALMIEWHGGEGPGALCDELAGAGFRVWRDDRCGTARHGMVRALRESPRPRARMTAEKGGALRVLRVHGTYCGATGHDRHVRGFVRALHDRGIAVELRDMPLWSPVRLSAALRDPWFDSLAAAGPARAVVHFCMPHQVVPDPIALNVNYTMFEATPIPAQWAQLALERPDDLVVVPTESSRRAWLAGGVPARQVRVSPLGVDPAFAAPPPAPLDLRDDAGKPLAARRVRFLNVSAPGTRKNLIGLIRTWLIATRADDDAVLVLKLLAPSTDVVEHLRARVAAIEHALRKPLTAAAPIHLVTDLLPDSAIPGLYAAATHYISLSFGEGWDQSMTEAAAAGLRLIAPAHSAYLTYLDPSVASFVPARRVPAIVEGPPDLRALFAGAEWWRPDEAAAAALVRAAIEGRDTPAANARERILGSYTMPHAAERLVHVIATALQQRSGVQSVSATVTDTASME